MSLYLQSSQRERKCHHCAFPSFISQTWIDHKFCISLTIESSTNRITKQWRAEPERKHIYSRVGNVESLSDTAAKLLSTHTTKTLQSQVHCAVARQVHHQILGWGAKTIGLGLRSNNIGSNDKQSTDLWWPKKPHFRAANVLMAQRGSRHHLPPSNPQVWKLNYYIGNKNTF